MNLTGQLPYQKTNPKNKKSNRANAEERAYWDRVSKIGCIVKNHECRGRITIHHTGTGAGGRKDHKKVLPLCLNHHIGDRGINSLNGKISRREWEGTYGTEVELLDKLKELL